MSYKGTASSLEALQPRYGGRIVEEVVTIEGDMPSMRYNWANGYTVEMTDQGAFVTKFIDLETIARAGDSWADEITLVRQVALDSSVRNETSGRTEMPSLHELDEAFSGTCAIGRLLTTRRAADLDEEFDLHFKTLDSPVRVRR